ncbi:MAG: tetratricopeptide repeat protein [Crocinitomix sp.]|nr:tetratricopeptide repeat protein [Crocinitomix sp.]
MRLIYFFRFLLIFLLLSQNGFAVSNNGENLLEKGLEYWGNGNLDSASTCFEEILITDTTSKVAADAFHNLGLVAYLLDHTDKGIENIQIAISLYEFHNAKKEKANALFNLGSIYKSYGNYELAANAFINAIDVFKVLEDKASLGKAYNALAQIQELLKNYNEAIKYYQFAFVIAKQQEQFEFIGNLYNNIGNVYKNQEQLDSARLYYNNSLALKKELNLVKGQAITLSNLAIVSYLEGDFEKSLEENISALNIKRQFNDSLSLAYSFNEIAGNYIELDKFDKAELYLDSARTYNWISDSPVLLRTLENEALLYAKQMKYNLAYLKANEYATLYSEYYDVNKMEQVMLLHETFETKRKEERLKKLEAEEKWLTESNQEKSIIIDRQERAIYIRNLILIIVALIALILGLASWNFYQKRKRREALKSLEVQSRLKESMGRDLHDILGSNLNGIRLMVQAVKSNDEATTEIIGEIANDLQHVSEQIRLVAHRLSPIGKRLEKIKFTELLDNFLSEFEHFHKIEIQRKTEFPLLLNQLSLSAQTNFYAIIQEIHTNIEKHTFSNRIKIEISSKKSRINFSISDNGNGFSDTNQSGIGIQNMEERMKTLNGKLAISSSKNGTVVKGYFPIKSHLK